MLIVLLVSAISLIVASMKKKKLQKQVCEIAKGGRVSVFPF